MAKLTPTSGAPSAAWRKGPTSSAATSPQPVSCSARRSESWSSHPGARPPAKRSRAEPIWIRAAGRSEASSAEATFARGAELKMAGDVEGARRELMVCLSTGDPEWAPCAAFEMGALLTKTKDVAGACDAYRLAIRLGHTNIAPKAAMNLGILLAEQGNTAGAGEAYRLAIASGHPDEAPRAAVNLGFLLLDTDRPAAVDAFELAIRSAHTEQAPIARINTRGLVAQERRRKDGTRASARRGRVGSSDVGGAS